MSEGGPLILECGVRFDGSRPSHMYIADKNHGRARHPKTHMNCLNSKAEPGDTYMKCILLSDPWALTPPAPSTAIRPIQGQQRNTTYNLSL
eukprot:4872553-Amphidinium_carterae.2